MYRGTPSPIFDVPEFPTLRRIKPLPKRRRTSGPTNEDANSLSQTPALPVSQNIPATNLQVPSQQRSTPLDPFFANATGDLLSHVDNLATRMALQNYYIPILGNVHNFLAGHGISSGNGDNGSNPNGATAAAAAAAAALAAVAGVGRNGPLPMPSLSDLDSIEFGVHFAAAAAAAAAAGLPMGAFGSLGMGLAGANMHVGATIGTATVESAAIGGVTPLFSNGAAPSGSTGEFGAIARGREEGSERDDDFDQVRQPGNTKKRKVPANLGGFPRDLGSPGKGCRPLSPSSSFLDEDGGDGLLGAPGGLSSSEADLSKARDVDRDRNRDCDSTPPPPVYPPPPFPGQLSMLMQNKGKLTAVTLAGLQHKEMLKARKRQLASVMGALSHGDTFALDQALSVNFSFAGEPVKVRKSKRRTVRLVRAMKVMMEMPDRKNRHPDAIPFPVSGFAFKCPSSTAERLISVKQEVATLRKRFEAELERQAAKAAKLAVAESGGSHLLTKSGRAKRERQERERERVARAARQKKAKSIPTPDDQTPELVDSRLASAAIGLSVESGEKTKSKNAKKKKRSALANASNPHHLRNYVPSRLPHSGPVDGAQSNANNIWPLPVRFLAAEIPTKGSKGTKKVPTTNTPLIQLTQPAEEWICAFCEYDLFYGDEAAYRKSVRNRKKILRRRKRAAERAAAASGNGGNTTLKTTPGPSPEDEYNSYEGPMVDECGSAPPQRGTRWKGAPDKESTASG